MRTARLAWTQLRRDLVAGEVRIMLAALVLAVVAVSAVGFVTDRAGRALAAEANRLLGGDAILRSNAPIGDGPREAARAAGLAVTETVELDSMIRAGGEPRLGDLRALGAGYPLRGTFRLVDAPAGAEREADAATRHQLLTFVVVGGGPTGVEVAGALAEMRRYALSRDFRKIDPREATVLLLEGGPRILPSYPPDLSARAKADLRAIGVLVREDTLVTNITAEAVEASDLRIPSTTVVWAAGNQASPLLASLGAPMARQGRVLVEPDCSIPGHPEVMVLGDAAWHEHDGQSPVPATCPSAIQMGQHAARVIRDRMAGKPGRPFRFRDKGQLAVIGRGQAVADLGRLHFGGFIAWFLWAFVHIAYLIGFRNRVLVLFEYIWSYVTFGHGARLITGETGEYAARITRGQ